MRWSYRLGRFFDIDVRVHVTFLMLLAWIAMQSYDQEKSLLSMVMSVLFTVTVFTFVVMHEYGHALTARRFGVRTRGITLFPIGGVAMLESMPKRPRDQILVALAGPAVNYVLASLLAVAMYALGYDVARDLSAVWNSHTSMLSELSMILGSLFWMNVLLGTFNLIPALPMDGGRVLSAALALRMDRLRATRIASRVAKVVAVIFIAVAFASDRTMLGVIGLFVWFTSSAELRVAEHRARTDGQGYTEVLGRTPWQRMAGAGSGMPGRRAPAAGVPGEVVEVVEGPDGPHVRVFRPR